MTIRCHFHSLYCLFTIVVIIFAWTFSLSFLSSQLLKLPSYLFSVSRSQAERSQLQCAWIKPKEENVNALIKTLNPEASHFQLRMTRLFLQKHSSFINQFWPIYWSLSLKLRSNVSETISNLALVIPHYDRYQGTDFSYGFQRGIQLLLHDSIGVWRSGNTNLLSQTFPYSRHERNPSTVHASCGHVAGHPKPRHDSKRSSKLFPQFTPNSAAAAAALSGWARFPTHVFNMSRIGSKFGTINLFPALNTAPRRAARQWFPANCVHHVADAMLSFITRATEDSNWQPTSFPRQKTHFPASSY